LRESQSLRPCGGGRRFNRPQCALLAGDFAVEDFCSIGESAGERVEIAEMGAQVAQHAADGVAVIVGAVLAVVDGVSAAAVGVSLEQAELT
jgi:hypothetical protein